MPNPTVADWLASAPLDQRKILEALRQLVLGTGPDIVESIKWSRPCYATTAGLFCYLHRSKNHVTIGFQRGGSLEDPNDMLEGDGKEMRHIKITSLKDVNRTALKAMLTQAYSFDG